MAESGLTYSERLRRRQQAWWHSEPTEMHPKAECHARLTRDDPEERWRCCPYWQRKLSNKWNAREFAIRHGARVPELYWHGRDVDAIPFDSLPSHFVVRATSGHSRQNVLLMSEGVSLFERRALGRDAIRQRLRRFLSRGARSMLLLVEEFVQTEGGEYAVPVDYKFHMFGSTIASIFVIDPATRHWKAGAKYDYYTRDWERIPEQFLEWAPSGTDRPPPRCLPEMKDVATRLGKAYDTYVRVDLYAGVHGCVFGEFSPVPGAGHGGLPPADAWFSPFWEEAFPDRL